MARDRLFLTFLKLFFHETSATACCCCGCVLVVIGAVDYDGAVKR
jgi:hypothetical protein